MIDSVGLRHVVKGFVNAEILPQVFLHIYLLLLFLLLCQAELLHSLALFEDIKLLEKERKQHSFQLSRVVRLLKDTVDGASEGFVPLPHLNA